MEKTLLKALEKAEDVSVTKTTVECYKIRNKYTWADITIDANGNTGRIQIASDYGSWQNYWGSCGKSFKEFLLHLDKHYVAGKFGADRWFDSEKTIKAFKQCIIENRRNGYLDFETAREAYDEAESLNDYTQETEFYRELDDKSEIMRLYDHCPDLSYGIESGFENFWNKVWPIFINTLESELASLKEEMGKEKEYFIAKSGRKYRQIPEDMDVETWDAMTPIQRMEYKGILLTTPSKFMDKETDHAITGR